MFRTSYGWKTRIIPDRRNARPDLGALVVPLPPTSTWPSLLEAIVRQGPLGTQDLIEIRASLDWLVQQGMALPSDSRALFNELVEKFGPLIPRPTAEAIAAFLTAKGNLVLRYGELDQVLSRQNRR